MVTMTPVKNAAPPAPAQQVQELIGGHRNTALMYVAAKLGIPDLLAAGPQTSESLAQFAGAHPAALRRILRGLVLLDVLSEEADGAFGLTPLGACLRSDAPGSLRGRAIVAGESFAPAWGGLLHSALTGEPAFDHVFGVSVWEHFVQHPHLNAYFNEGMARTTAGVTAAIVAAYDFTRFPTIADIGGGHGALLTAILQAHPEGRGLLFDQPHVVTDARPHLEAAGVADRCKVVGGSFFEAVPPGADAYILKSILHDWNDERSIAILRTCRRAMAGVAGTTDRPLLLPVEQIMPVRAAQSRVTIGSDLHMLAMTGGRERTEAEWRSLLAEGGFTLTRVVPTASPRYVIEAEPAAA